MLLIVDVREKKSNRVIARYIVREDLKWRDVVPKIYGRDCLDRWYCFPPSHHHPLLLETMIKHQAVASAELLVNPKQP